MGAGIAAVSIDKDIKTHLLDLNDKGVARGENQIYKHYEGLVKRRKITDFQRHLVLSNLKPTFSYNDLRNCDLVVEAVFEELPLKHKVIKQVRFISFRLYLPLFDTVLRWCTKTGQLLLKEVTVKI